MSTSSQSEQVMLPSAVVSRVKIPMTPIAGNGNEMTGSEISGSIAGSGIDHSGTTVAPQSPVAPVFPRALVGQVIAMPAGEQLAVTVEFGHPPAAIDAVAVDGAEEPGPGAAEMTWRPFERHPLLNALPVAAVASRR